MASLVEIVPVVLEMKIFNLNFVHVFSLFGQYLPLKSGVALLLNKSEFPSPKSLVEIGLVVW